MTKLVADMTGDQDELLDALLVVLQNWTEKDNERANDLDAVLEVLSFLVGAVVAGYENTPSRERYLLKILAKNVTEGIRFIDRKIEDDEDRDDAPFGN